MNDPVFLSIQQIEELHDKAIRQFGGTDGVRDRATLESAIFHPHNVFFYGKADLYDIAAAYAFHLAEAQAFLDGNKRVAVAAALTFLEANGIRTNKDSLPLYGAMISISQKMMSKLELAALMRQLFPS